MATETVQTTQTKAPGKQEFKEEIKGETAEGVRYETKNEYKTEARHAENEASARIGQGQAIIHRNVMWSLGAGVVPLPIFDIVAITGVEIKMLKELSDLYGVPFKQSVAKKLVYSLLSGVGSVALGAAIGSSLAKMIPAVGTTLGVISVPIFAGAVTHAVGKVFLMHFESGGTFLDFDPYAMRSHFKREYETGRENAQRYQKEEVRVSSSRA